jgi:hypothetical protein
MNAIELEIRNCNSLCTLNLLADTIGLALKSYELACARELMEIRREEIRRECARRGFFHPCGHNPWR